MHEELAGLIGEFPKAKNREIPLFFAGIGTIFALWLWVGSPYIAEVSMRRMSQYIACVMAAGLIAAGVGCNEIEKNPRTWGTIGASVDDHNRGEGAVVGGVIGGAAGNVGGKVYKDNR